MKAHCHCLKKYREWTQSIGRWYKKLKYPKRITFVWVSKFHHDFFSFFTAVVQVVLDITTFYIQTYNKFTTTEDQRLKETLKVIHTGVSYTCSLSHSYEFSRTQLSSYLTYIWTNRFSGNISFDIRPNYKTCPEHIWFLIKFSRWTLWASEMKRKGIIV